MFRRRRLFFKVVRIIAMFVIGLFVAVLIALSQVNLETLRGDLLAILRNDTGMQIEIDGDISWKFSLRPKVELNNVRIPNADWAQNKNGFVAERVDVTLNLISLMRDKPVIQSIKMHNVVVFLEQNNHGEHSIIRRVDEKRHPENSVPNGTNGKYPFDLNLGLESIEITNITANIFGHTYFLQGFNLTNSYSRSSKEYSGWLKSDSKIYPFIISFSQFNEERKVYPVRMALSTGGDALVANIALEGTSKMPIDFIVRGNISDILPLGHIFGVELPKMPTIQVNLAGGFGNKKITLRKSDINIRGTDLTISGGMDWSHRIPALTLKLKSKKIDLTEVFPELYSPGPKWVRPNRELNVFKDIPLHGEEFLGFNFSLTADIENLLVYRDMSIKNINLTADLKDARVRVDVKTNFADGEVRASTEILIDKDGTLDVRAAGIGERVYVGEIMKSIRETNFISELPANFEFYVQGRGRNLSELISNTTGPIYIYSVGHGYAHSELVTYMYGTDFLTDLRHNIQDLFRSKKKNDQIRISCAAVNIKVRNGRVDTENGIAFETNAINLRFAGNVDFGRERMRLSLTTVPVRGLKLSLTGSLVKSIEISGNLAEPDVKLSGSAVVGKVASATGIGLLLAPFTGGLGLVAGAGVGFLASDLLENWLADDNPCRTAMNRGAPGKPDDPQWLNKPMSELVSGLIDNK